MMSTRLFNILFGLTICCVLMACEDSDVRLSRAALDSGDYDKALNILALAADRSPRDATVRSLISIAHVRKGNLREANSWMTQAQQLGLPNDEAGRIISDEAKRVLSQDANYGLELYGIANNFSASLSKSTARELGQEANNLITSWPLVALQLYRSAGNYDSSLAPAMAKKILESANAKLETEMRTALQLYKAAVELDSTLAGTAADTISQVAKAKIISDLPVTLELISVAVDYSLALKPTLAKFLAQAATESLKQGNVPRANTLAQAAVKYDSNVAPHVTSAWFDHAKELNPELSNWKRVVELARFVQQIGTPTPQAWSDLIYTIAATNEKLSPADRVDVGRLAITFDKSKSMSLSKLYVQFGKAEIAQDPPLLASAGLLFKAALSFDPTVKDVISRLIWGEYERWLFTPVELGRERFRQFFALSGEFGVPSQYKDGLDLYALALKQQLDGNRVEAIRILSQLVKSRPKSKEGSAAAAILAPPKPGTRTYNTSAFRMDNPMPAGTASINIRLVTATVTTQDIELRFNIKSWGNLSYFLKYGVRPETGQYSTCGKPYLIDDLGMKSYALTGFLGGNQKPMNDFNCAMTIELAPNEEVNLNIRLPMIGPGATSLTFVSPELFGWQSEWRWSHIPLKNDPFDPPLNVQSMTRNQQNQVPAFPVTTSPDVPRPAVRADVQQQSSTKNSYYYVANAQPPDAFLSLRTEPSSRSGSRIKAMANGTILQVKQKRSDAWWNVKIIPSGEEGWALSSQGNQTWIECCKTFGLPNAETGMDRATALRAIMSVAPQCTWNDAGVIHFDHNGALVPYSQLKATKTNGKGFLASEKLDVYGEFDPPYHDSCILISGAYATKKTQYDTAIAALRALGVRMEIQP